MQTEKTNEKKLGIIMFSIIGLAMLIVAIKQMGDRKTARVETRVQRENLEGIMNVSIGNDPSTVAMKDAALMDQLHQQLLWIETNDELLAPKTTEDLYSLLESNLYVWEDMAADIRKAKSTAVDSLTLKADAVTKALSSMQLKYFPKFRKAYAKQKGRELWRNNIEVAAVGKRGEILQLTGGVFASNANIEDTQKMINGTINKLRFKQVQYRWYEDASEFTYYDIKSPSDGAVKTD